MSGGSGADLLGETAENPSGTHFPLHSLPSAACDSVPYTSSTAP